MKNILCIIGSHRKDSESKRIAMELGERSLKNKFTNVKYHDISSMNIDMWDEGVWNGDEKWKNMESVLEDQKWADAFVVVTPEYGGMVPAMLKNYFIFAGQNTMGNKPALIVSVSSGMGGAYVVNELRTSSYKNTKLCYIPEQVVIRKCESLFIEESKENTYIIDRLDFTTTHY